MLPWRGTNEAGLKAVNLLLHELMNSLKQENKLPKPKRPRVIAGPPTVCH
jgi:hypothetical protein